MDVGFWIVWHCRRTRIGWFYLAAGLLWIAAGCGPRSTAAPTALTTATKASVDPASTPAAPFRLVEVAQERGLRFRHTHGSRTPLTIVETMGSGCALFDFDGDGWLDVFLVNAGEDFQKPRQASGSRLYRNRGDGTFEDVTAQSGLNIESYAMGCCVGDFDNDGFPDLFVSGYGRNYLFRNRGIQVFQRSGVQNNPKPEDLNPRTPGSPAPFFEDVTAKAGLLQRPGAWGMGCAFVDIDRDGWLDLYVANYVRYDPKIPYCKTADVPHGCTPNQYPTQANELYINQRNGTFREEAKARGAEDTTGAGLGVVVADFDNDGWPDIFVANDGTPNALLHNRNGRFENVGQAAGVAFAEEGGMRAGMGTDAADIDADGLPDLVITNFQHEPNSLYKNTGGMMFQEISYPSGTGTPSLTTLGFGVVFADLDGDGRPDLYVGNGHVYDNVTQFDDSTTFEQTDLVFHNEGGGRFAAISPSAGAYPAAPSVARAIAVGDFNNDGTPDLLINNLGRPVRLLENRPVKPGHWLGLRLEGLKSNRSAIGARVTLEGTPVPQMREVRSGGSYLAHSDLRVLFPLGDLTDPARLTITIRWPSGKTQTWKPTALDNYISVKEPQ